MPLQTDFFALFRLPDRVILVISIPVIPPKSKLKINSMELTGSEKLYNLFRQHPYISIDSRKTQAGSIFFALKGDNFNGNRFAGKALEQGAAYAVIDDPAFYAGEKTLLTTDVLSALQTLASDYRKSLNIPILGITGTNGKTTSKELIYAALSSRFTTHATSGNLNNHIGVPLTLLTITPETEIAVVEMGANHIGEIAALCAIARPTHGIITNIGKAHLEGFGSPEGVVTAKNELYEHLRAHGGTAFVNLDNELLNSLSQDLQRITYGSSKTATYRGSVSGTLPLLSVTLHSPAQVEISSQLTGMYNFENIMAAMAVAGHFRANLKSAAESIEKYIPRMNRSQVIETGNNSLVLDAYNANPSSMQAALANFADSDAGSKSVILGDMFELGTMAAEEHLNILKLAVESGFRNILTAGPNFRQASSGFNSVVGFDTTEELHNYLKTRPMKGEVILIKGSRGMKLETITDAL